ncbi:MAG: hypothetical protein AB1730_23470 [Myxococcota bacterium]|jgi:hypothetical protein
MKSLPRSMSSLFWDSRPECVDLARDADDVLARVLESDAGATCGG